MITDSISRDQSEFGAMFEEDVASCLRRIDPDAVVCNDGACLGRRFELFCGKFDNSSEGCRIWHAENLVRQFWI